MKFRLKRPGPLVQMTLALVSLAALLVLLADLLFGVLSGRDAELRSARAQASEVLAAQVAVLLQNADEATLRRTLDFAVQRDGAIASVAVRRADSTRVHAAGPHEQLWQPRSDARSLENQVTVPLLAGGVPWGRLEVAYKRPTGHAVANFLRQPLVATLLFISVAGAPFFWLYMRRALQHLDPSSVVPKRVQGAFDAMAEGVTVLDAKGRILLANHSMRRLADIDDRAVGQPMAALSLWSGALAKDAQAHPWARAMAERGTSSGHTLQVDAPSGTKRHLVISCAAISDPGGDVRGCMVTVADVSELHQANLALRVAMDELSASKEEVQRQNAELTRLATRDPLTGCLNRRSFMADFERILAAAVESDAPVACIMVDIDHFKKINDQHGHGVGDRVIQQVAKLLQGNARGSDLVCRYGGEEFCVVVPGLPRPQALAFAERVRRSIETECGPGVREVPGMRVTASIGVDLRETGVHTPGALIDRADQALYRSKRGGRNAVTAYEETAEAPLQG